MVVLDRRWLKVGKGHSGHRRDPFVAVAVVVGCRTGTVCSRWGTGRKGDSFLAGAGAASGLGCICSRMGSAMAGPSRMGCSGSWVLDAGEITHSKRCSEIHEIREAII